MKVDKRVTYTESEEVFHGGRRKINCCFRGKTIMIAILSIIYRNSFHSKFELYFVAFGYRF